MRLETEKINETCDQGETEGVWRPFLEERTRLHSAPLLPLLQWLPLVIELGGRITRAVVMTVDIEGLMRRDAMP